MTTKLGAKPYVILDGVYFQEDGKWIGECEQLGTATFADTLDKAQVELAEMVLMHLNGLEKVGQRSVFFKKHGIKVYSDSEMPESVDRRMTVMMGAGAPQRIGPLPFALRV